MMPVHISSKRFALLSLLGAMALSTGCGSADDAAGSKNTGGAGGASGTAGTSATSDIGGEAGAAACPDFMGAPVVGPGPGGGCHAPGGGVCYSCITLVEGMSFAAGTFTTIDDSGVTVAHVRTEPGAVCASGTNVGYAILQLAVGRPDTIVAADGSRGKPFDAQALGVTQLEFTIDTPPSSGLVPAIAIEGADTHAVGFALTTSGAEVSIQTPSTMRVSLSDYTDPDHTLDPSRILAIGFTIGLAEHYDFCVRNLKFFNANDVEVLPTP
jgi:hypothetical protein